MGHSVALGPLGNSRKNALVPSAPLPRPTHRENLLAGPPEENGTGLGVFALSDKREVLISDFLDFQQACACPNIIFSQFLRSADYPGPTGSIDWGEWGWGEGEPRDFRYFYPSP